MSFIRKTLFLSLICLFVAGTAIAANKKGSTKITKCQDASGTWHYGRTAADECAQSKIIEMDKRGLTRKVIAAPPSERDLEAHQLREEERKKEEQRLAEQKRRDQVLLGLYSHEDDIILVRDRKHRELENSIKATEDTLTGLRSALTRMQAQAADDKKSRKSIERAKVQIANHEAAIVAKRKEQHVLRDQYTADLERFRELKTRQSRRAETK